MKDTQDRHANLIGGEAISFDLPTAGVDYGVTFSQRKGSPCGAREQGCHAVDFHTVKVSYISAG